MENWTQQVQQHAGRPLVMDSNVMVVLVVGLADRKAVERFGRTSAFTVKDFWLLSQITDFFAKRQGLATTPHVLTEVSNHLRGRPEFRKALAAVVETSRERYTAAKNLINQDHVFSRVGLCRRRIGGLGPRDPLRADRGR